MSKARRLKAEKLEQRILLSISLQPQDTFDTGNFPHSVTVADLGNGHPGLVLANEGAGTVSVLLGNGHGDFQRQQAYAVGQNPISVAVADLGNGHPDLVVANNGSDDISVLLGNGDGTFQAAQSIAVGTGPDSVAIADLGNGHPDVIVSNFSSDNVTILLGNGDGTFQAPQTIAVGSAPQSVAVADLGNHKPDLVVANFGSNNVSVLLGNGDGTFQPQQTFATDTGPFSAVVADLGNGHPDIVTANFGSTDTASVLLGNGDGTFQPQQTVATGAQPAAVAVADLGNGHPDLVVANYGSNSLGILQGNGDGTFQAQQTFATDSQPIAVAVGDTNGDGHPDVFVANAGSNNVGVFLGNGDLTPLPTAPIKTIGGLDPTFGTGGLASHDVGFSSTAGVVEDANGNSVIAGTSTSHQFGLTRYTNTGSLDTSFGVNGVVTSSFGGSDQTSAVAYLPSTGDILVAGTDTMASGSRFVLAEYTSAGVLDTSFNGTGFVLTSFSTTPGTLSHDTANAIAVSADGSTIYVAGSSDAAGKGLDFAVASFKANGSPNTRFNGATGTTLLDFAGGDDVINAVTLQSNGNLVAVGFSVNPTTGVAAIALARFLPTGILDSHFGTKGKTVTGVRGVADIASSVVLDRTGKIVIGGLSAIGSASNGLLSSDFLVARYTATGIVDRTFGGGPVITDFGQPSAVSQVLVQSDGSIIASGKTVSSLNGLDPTQLQVALARYTTSGKPDTSFNTTGNEIISLSGASAQPAAQAAAASPLALATFTISPLDTTTSLLAEFAQFQQTAQGVVAITQGGELLDVGNSGSNTVEAEIVTSGIDLAAAIIAKLPPTALEGARQSLSVKVTESGSNPATGTVTIQLFASPNGLVNVGQTPFQSFPERLVNLRQNQSRTFPVRYALPSSAGQFFVVANINTGTLTELNANTNIAASASAVKVDAPFTDLAGTGLTSTGTPAAGKFATINFTVTNSGNILARSVPVQILASTDGTVAHGTPIAQPTLLLNLPPSTTRKYRLTFRIPTTLAANTYVLVAVLDPAGNTSTITGQSTSFTVG